MNTVAYLKAEAAKAVAAAAVVGYVESMLKDGDIPETYAPTLREFLAQYDAAWEASKAAIAEEAAA